MAVEAAVEGLGIAIGHQALVARELESGRLIEPFDLRVPAPHGYAVIAPAWSSKRQDVGDFIEWLREAV
jgi:LysR family glycine cleavage system transcriptional activator